MRKIIKKTSLTILTIILFTTSCVEEQRVAEQVLVLPPRVQKKEVINFFADLPFDSKKEIKIALLVPLTGPHKQIGEDLFKAAQLALFDHGDPRIVIYPYDTEASEFKSIKIIDKIVADNIKFIVGPVFAKNVKAIKPVAKEHDIKIFTFSNNTDIAGDGVYVLGVDVKQQIARLIDYSISNGYEYFSALAPANHFGSDAVKQLRLSAQNKAMILKSEFYNSNNSLRRNVKKILKSMAESPVNEKGFEIFKEISLDELTKQIIIEKQQAQAEDSAIAELNEQQDNEVSEILTEEIEEHIYRDIDEYKRALLLADSANNLEIISELTDFSEFAGDFKILGTSLMGKDKVMSLDIFTKAWFTDLPSENIVNFEQHFANTYGYLPQNISIFSYDIISVISALASYNQVYNMSYLESYAGFSGVSGVFRFNKDGIVERLFEIYEIKDGLKNTIDPAPFQFLDITNN